MKTLAVSNRVVNVAQSVREIRSTWTSTEREHRARAGQRRREQFVAWLQSAAIVPEVWATGALTAADLQRLAG
ncbi:MAG: hypothetical protein JNM18_13665 [Planctomycetaceae bacterium]|nr:hypothetical protein [Planctomycetaceae bacterium]